MSDFQISEAEIEQLLAEPIVELESETEPLLANPPIISNRFRFGGDMSLTRALAHPELGPALQDFHDRLVWSEDEPEVGAEGIELFRLNAFFHAGYPIVSMPPPRVAARIIWDQTMRLLDPEYRAATKRVRTDWPDLSPVLIGRTIHGSRTLLRHHVRVQRQIVAEFNGRGDPIQFGEYAELAEGAAIRAADRYDRRHPSGAAFPTYLHRRLRGAIIDWRRSSPPMQSIDPSPEGYLDSRNGLVERLSSGVGSYYPGGQKSVIAVPSDDWLAEGLVDLGGERVRLEAVASAANLTGRQKVILAHLRRREGGYAYLAQKLDISYDHLKVEISRLKKKLRAVVTNSSNHR